MHIRRCVLPRDALRHCARRRRSWRRLIGLRIATYVYRLCATFRFQLRARSLHHGYRRTVLSRFQRLALSHNYGGSLEDAGIAALICRAGPGHHHHHIRPGHRHRAGIGLLHRASGHWATWRLASPLAPASPGASPPSRHRTAACIPRSHRDLGSYRSLLIHYPTQSAATSPAFNAATPFRSGIGHPFRSWPGRLQHCRRHMRFRIWHSPGSCSTGIQRSFITIIQSASSPGIHRAIDTGMGSGRQARLLAHRWRYVRLLGPGGQRFRAHLASRIGTPGGPGAVGRLRHRLRPGHRLPGRGVRLR